MYCPTCGSYHHQTSAGCPYVPFPRTLGHYTAPRQVGWECPKCGAVMAPGMPSCYHCKPMVHGTANTYHDIFSDFDELPEAVQEELRKEGEELGA